VEPVAPNIETPCGASAPLLVEPIADGAEHRSERGAYPTSDTITNNTLCSIGSSTDVMVVDSGGGPTNTHADQNFQAASDIPVYTPGAFNFQSSSITGCCNLH
jgi:hypothetical protein